jgi:hypothetical protein
MACGFVYGGAYNTGSTGNCVLKGRIGNGFCKVAAAFAAPVSVVLR